MADQTQIQRLKNIFQGKTQRVFVLALGLSLLLRLLIFVSEANFMGDPPAEVEPITSLKSEITEGSDTYKDVHKMTRRWADFSQSDYSVLASFNMFDYKLVLDAAKIEQRATQKFEEAYGYYKQGNLSGALELLEETLKAQPNHRPAQTLRKEIYKRLGRAEDGTSTKTTTQSTTSTTPTATPKPPGL